MSDRTSQLQAVNASEGASGVGAVDWGRYLDVLRRRKWIFIAATAVTCLLTAAYTLRQPKQYLASVSIVIDTSTPRVLTGVEEVVDVGTTGWVPDSFYETEYEIMKSRAVARAAGNKIRVLDDDTRTGLAGLDPAARAAKKQQLDAADLTLGRYNIEPDKRSSVVRISVVDTVPAFTAQLANAVADAYVEQNLDKRIMGTRDASSWLSVQDGELKTKLEASEDALYRFMEDNDVLNASLESQLSEVLQRLTAFNVQLAQEEASSIRERKAAEALERVKLEPKLIDTLEPIQSAPVINTIKASLEELRSEREKLATRYQADHPKMDENAKQLKRLEERLHDETDAVLTLQRRKQDQSVISMIGLRDKLTQEREHEARLNKLSLMYARLKREVSTNEKLYGMVTNRMKEADITSALPFNNVRVLDRALTPTLPFKPNLQKNMLVGLVLGLLLGVGLVLLIDLLDNTVKSQEDIERLGAPFLGLLPLIEATSGRERDLHTFNEPKSAAAECARFIRTNLLFMSPDRALKTLVVTSPAPKEGKTTTCITLAVTMAQAGSRTLLVDTDLRRPRLHRVFGMPNETGLSSVIVGEATLDKVIQRTKMENLDVLVCGPLPPNPAEILHTDRFAEVIKELKTRYDRILFDSPPVGPVTDPVVIGAQVDGVVLVVKCEKTTREMAGQALRALADANARMLGVILNDVDVSQKRYSRVYYSYYRAYGAYYGEDEDSKKSGEAA